VTTDILSVPRSELQALREALNNLISCREEPLCPAVEIGQDAVLLIDELLVREDLPERKLFEQWYESNALPAESDWFRLEVDGDYFHSDTAAAWEGWSARSNLCLGNF